MPPAQVDARRFPSAPTSPTSRPAAATSSPATVLLESDPSSIAPTIVATAPITTNGVAAPASRRRSRATAANRKLRPTTSDAPPVSLDEVLPEPKVLDAPLELPNGVAIDVLFVTLDSALPLPTWLSTKSQANRSASARKTARPRVPTSR